ncbi:MAG: hypothetical protein HOP08_19200 [Cyclobacteriaceae bacterium]|nr:hypothetical protein [Cyclobacteriaceae bacterium]
MNYKPDEATLISYLYGELDSDEQMKVAEYLQNNPEEKKRLDGMSFAQTAFAHLHDKEVIAPSIILNDERAEKPFWKENYFRMPLGIAASLMTFLVAAKLIGLSLTYAPGEIKIGFGEKVEVIKEVPALTEDQIAEMINSSVASNNESIKASWTADRNLLEKAIQKNLNSNSTKIDQLMKTASAANQEQVTRFVGQLQNDNLKLMKDYMQLSATGQKEYIESLLVDFSKYLQEQRKQDIQLFSARVNKVEQNTDLFKQETEQILTSLISTGNPIQKRN